jgi:predicted phage baseplate assembly protein
MKGEIRFGDGLQGKVPPKGTEIQALEYETGIGDHGNLPAGSMWTVKGEKPEGLTISNLKPAVDGKREESIDESFEHFIRDLWRVPYRAVTSEDFEYIARETPGLRIAQAKVIPNFDPYIQAEREGVVTVVIIPFSPLNVLETPPEPSPGFKAAVARHVEKHRLLGTRVYVVSPEYVRVEVKVTLEISRGFFKEEIRKAVLEKLNLYLHPAKGGPNRKGWPVGKPVYRSEIYRLIMETEGVGLIQKINISAQNGAKSDENGDLKLTSKTATVYSGKHSVEIQAFS